MKFDLTITITTIIAIAMAIFAISAFVVRAKDMQAMRPMIESIPLIQRDVGELKASVAKMEGIMSVIPAMNAHIENQGQRIDAVDKQHERLEDRVLALERLSRNG